MLIERERGIHNKGIKYSSIYSAPTVVSGTQQYIRKNSFKYKKAKGLIQEQEASSRTSVSDDLHIIRINDPTQFICRFHNPRISWSHPSDAPSINICRELSL